MWHCVVQSVVPAVLKEGIAFIFKGQATQRRIFMLAVLGLPEP